MCPNSDRESRLALSTSVGDRIVQLRELLESASTSTYSMQCCMSRIARLIARLVKEIRKLLEMDKEGSTHHTHVVMHSKNIQKTQYSPCVAIHAFFRGQEKHQTTPLLWARSSLCGGSW